MNEKLDMTDALAKEFIVAVEIYHSNINNKKICCKELVTNLKLIVCRDDTKNAIKFLLNWGIITAEYDSDINKRILKIKHDSKDIVKQLYEMCWLNYRDSKIFKK